MNVARLITGTLLAPLAAPLPFWLLSLWSLGGGSLAQEIRAMASLFMIIYFSGLAVAVVAGIPAHLAYRRLGWRRLWSYLAGGAVIGAVGGQVVIEWLLGDLRGPGRAPEWEAVALMATSGALSAGVFWWWVVRRQAGGA